MGSTRLAKKATHQQVVVHSKEQFDVAIQRFLAMGYGPRQMTAELAILVKPGQQKNLGCAFIFWCLAFFPIAIMMAVARNKQAQESTVTIRLDATGGSVLPPPDAPAPPLPQALSMSEDRQSWWDGANWVSVASATPPMAKKNPDGSLWWDGEEWRAVR